MAQWLLTWMPLIGTLVLVAVTAWYAILTKQLAESSERSAKSAQVAAEIAAQSVAATIANVPIEFRLGPMYYLPPRSGGTGELDNGEFAFGVVVACAGATVFLHGALLVEASAVEKRLRGGGEMYRELVQGPVELEFGEDAGQAPPIRLHKGEDVRFLLPVDKESTGDVAVMRVRVRYSLDGKGDGIERTVSWHGKAGRDYPLRGEKNG